MHYLNLKLYLRNKSIIFVLALLLSSLSINAQQTVKTFVGVPTFRPTKSLNKLNSKHYSISLKDIYNFVNQNKNKEQLNFKLKLGDDYNWNLELTKSLLVSQNYEFKIVSNNKTTSTNHSPTHTYTGHLKGKVNGAITLIITEHYLSGSVTTNEETYSFMSTLNSTTLSDPVLHITKESAIDPPHTTCHHEQELDEMFRKIQLDDSTRNDPMFQLIRIDSTQNQPILTRSSKKSGGSCKLVELAIAGDSRFLAHQFGGQGVVANAEARLLEIVSYLNQHYASVNIAFVVTQVVISTSIDTDASPVNTAADQNTIAVSDTWAASNFTANYDVGSYITGDDLGWAWGYLDVICGGGTYNTSITGEFANHSALLLAHEIGHNMGLPHVNNPANIMNPTIWETSNSWSESSKTILTSTAQRACFTEGNCDIKGSITDSPVVGFTSDRVLVQEGMRVIFTDTSYSLLSINDWTWTFEGGTPNTFVGQNPPDILYSTAGLFTVKLAVTNPNGTTTETKTGYIQVNSQGPPLVDFTADTLTVTLGESVNFTDLSGSTQPITKWNWSFEGTLTNISTDQNPSNIVYNLGVGTFKVSLTTTNSLGSSTETKNSYINVLAPEAPLASFAYAPNPVLEGQSITVTEASVSAYPIQTWEWSFSGGTPNSFTGQTPPTITYNTEGEYTIQLTVTHPGGSHTATQQINVIKTFTPPTADFSGNPLVISEGDIVNFTDLSTGEIVNWDWSFTGGFPESYTKNNTPPSINYSLAGTYPVTLTVSNPAGSSSETKTLYIKVNPVLPPTVDFSANNLTVTVGDTVHFTNLTSPFNTITNWSWFIPGAVPSTPTNQNPWVVYRVPGIFPVRLTVTNKKGVTDLLQKTGYITVLPQTLPPTSKIKTSATIITKGQSISFADNSQDNGASITAYEWTFPGGIPLSSNLEHPGAINFSTSGVYEVQLKTTNSAGFSIASVNISVIGINTIPIANFTSSATTINKGEVISFTDVSNPNGDVITDWEWTFNGGTPNTSTSQNPEAIVFDTPGTYDVTLKITNSSGTHSKTIAIEVQNPAVPTTDFTSNFRTVKVGETITFVDLSSSNGNTITDWNWKFTGGTPSSSLLQQPPIIKYNLPGIYKVELTTTNVNGENKKTETAYITVTELTPPDAQFKTEKTSSLEAGQCISFEDLSVSSTPITKWYWTFEDGIPSSSSEQNPRSIVFPTVGNHKVTLTVTNTEGTSTEEKNAYINVTEKSATPYCSALRTGDCNCEFEYIKNISLIDVKNSNSIVENETTCGNYSYYNSITGSILTLNEYELTVEYGNLDSWTPATSVFFDWNNDNDFTEDEEISLTFNATTKTSKAIFVTPSNVVLSTQLRFRVRVRFPGTVNACGNSETGETEDYNLIVAKNPDEINPETGLFNKSNSTSFEIFPNPTKGSFYARFSSFTDQKVDFIIYNQLGNEVYNQSSFINGNNTTEKIVVDHLPKGVYIISVIGKSFTSSQVIIIK